MKESIIGSIYSQVSFNRKRVQIAMNGALDYYDFAVSPIIYNGSEGCVLRIDIVTEQVKLEERIIQSEKMMSITGLAAGMAHEINNPLAGIIQNAQNIERRLFEPSAKNIEVASQIGVNFEKIQEYLKNRSIERMVNGITVSGLKAAKIIKNIQRFSKKSSINFISINICELLETTLNLAKESFNTTNSYDFSKIKLVKDSDLNCPPLICDTNKLQQALFNIITNCAEAMVDIENPTLTIRVFRDGKWLIVEIEDNGHGMSEEVRKRVFEPFFTTKIVGKGPGLGLSIAYFIIADFHNGDLSLESDEGVGTKCIIRLPLIKE